MPKEQCWMLNDECSHSHTLTLSHSHISHSHTHILKKLNRSSSQQRTLHCYSAKDKRDTTVHHSHNELCILASKQTRLNRAPSQHSTLYCYIEGDKTEPFSIPNREFCLVISKKTRRAVAYPNRDLCIVISNKAWLNRSSSEQRTLHCYIEKGKTEPFFQQNR